MTKLGSKAFLRRAGHLLATASVAAAALAFANAASAQTLTIESWRTDDADIWNNQIIPAFEKANPDIKVVYKADPPTEYNAALNSRLAGGTAGDIITCRPFDASLDLFNKGYLTPLNDVPGMDELLRRRQGGLDHGRRQDHLLRADGLGDPRLLLQQEDLRGARSSRRRRRSTSSTPSSTRSRRTASTCRCARHRRSVGGRHHGLPEYRPELLEGRGGPQGADRRHSRSSPIRPMSRRLQELANWAPYMGDGYQAQKYPDSQNLFTLGQRGDLCGRLVGHADLPQAGGLRVRRLPAARREGRRHLLHQRPHGHRIGINAKSTNAEAAKNFLAWVASPEFAEIYANALPGFFPLSNAQGRDRGPVAAGVRRLARHLRRARSATPTRSCPAARPTSRTSCGT